MENQRLAFGPLVVFDFANENYVVAGIVLADAAANEVGRRAFQQRAAGAGFETFGVAEAILELGGELAGEMMLAGGQDIDGEMGGLVKSARSEESRVRHQRTSGGSSETEENEFTVRPTRRPSFVRVVTIATPVAY